MAAASLRNDPCTYFTLPGGLRLVCQTMPGRLVEYFGVAVNVGSRDESPQREGLSHFVEHTIFKGTSHRRARHIANRMEAVGGELNAYTTKEETNVYTIFPRGNLQRAIELVADLTINSSFPAAELDKEREVVRDEIDSYLDTPSEAVYDDFEELAFAGSPLAHNILGNSRLLDHFDTAACRSHISSGYTTGRTVAYYLGSANPRKVADMVARYFEAMPAGAFVAPRVAPSLVTPFNHHKHIDSHQAHTVVGSRIGGVKDGRRHAVGLLTNILGGPGMNSRLNQELREKRGLVYTVEASTNLMSDSGLFTVYYGCDPEDNALCRELVNKELKRISSEALSSSALAAAKKQYLGQWLVSTDNLEQQALTAGRATLFLGRVSTPAEVRGQIEGLTSQNLLEAAQALCPEVCSSLTLL